MQKQNKFNLSSINELKSRVNDLNLDIPVSEKTGILCEPIIINNFTVPNRMAIHPMEGCDGRKNGAPDKLTFRRYKRFGGGGAGLLWFEATAVTPEARANPRQLWINSENVMDFKDLLMQGKEAARAGMGNSHNPLCILQLTHSGRYSRPVSKPAPIIAHHSKILDPMHNLPDNYPLISDKELYELQNKFVEAAKLAAWAGFDGIDIKSCHRYLISELLASFTRENSDFGGSFENRTRFLAETASKISQAVPEIMVCCRLNCYDAIEYPFGFGVDKKDYLKPDLNEPKKLISLLKSKGVKIVNTTIGNPYYNPHFGRPYDLPVKNAPTPPIEDQLKTIDRFLKITAELQEEAGDLPLVGTGYTWLRELFPFVAAGVLKKKRAALIGLGRMAFAYPDFAGDIIKNGGINPDKTCIACSGCTQIMRDHGRAGCIIRDQAVYGTIYKQGRKESVDYAVEKAGQCLECFNATCSQGCPANVDVPGFLKKFAQGDIRGAYAILKRNNILPELCAYICPSEVQCEGSCIQATIRDSAVPIKDIQKIVCREARKLGLTKLTLPERKNDKNIAVIGAGPAGISCALQLIEYGYKVTVFDSAKSAGGIPNRIIPRARLDNDDVMELKSILTGEFNERLTWKFNSRISSENNIDNIKIDYNAVFIAVGLEQSLKLDRSLEYPDGVIGALEFLSGAKSEQIDCIPRSVAVIGGGNSAMDSAITAKELGAMDVFIIYRRSFNELPAWPNDLDHAIKKGIHFIILTQPVSYVSENKKLKGVKVARTRLGTPDSSGRRRPEIIKGSEYVFEAELCIEAIGQEISPDTRKALKRIKISNKGLIELKPGTQATSMDGVFAGGDITNGGTTAVRAVAEGIKAAREIREYLGGKNR
ncbi:MAG: FAD-dependent oxidoreductase [bacterium]